MSKLYSRSLIFLVIILYCLLALLYGNNQYLSEEGQEILNNGFNIHYTQDIFDFTSNSLTTLVISIPMQIYENIYSPLILLILIRFASFLILFNTLKNFFKQNTLIWFSVLYLLLPWFLPKTQISYISYLELGVSIYFLSVCKLSNMDISKIKSFFWSIVLMLGISWCIPFHYSWTVLSFISAFLLLRRAIKFNALGFVVGCVFMVLLTIPHINEISNNFNDYSSNLMRDGYFGYGVVNVYPILKSILYWVRFSSMLGQNWILIETDFTWLGQSECLQNNAKILWLAVVYTIGTFSLLVSLCANYLVCRNCKNLIFTLQRIENKCDFLRVFVVCSLASIVIYSALAPFLLASKELNICYSFSLLPVLLVIDKYNQSDRKHHAIWLILVLTYLSILNFCAAVESPNFDNDANYSKQAESITDKFFN